MLGFSIGRVCGNSMLPRITPDSFIIAIKTPRWYPKRIGQMFYIAHPRYGRIVKTLVAIDDKQYWFRGESAESVSTEAIGAISEEQLIGRVVWVVYSDLFK